MQLDFEQRILRNPAAGAILLWEFAYAYRAQANALRGPNLPELMLVLPMAFHASTVRKVRRMLPASGLARAISAEPDILAGLQDRLESLASLSFEALSVAHAAGLLTRTPGDGWPHYSPMSQLPRSLESLSPGLKDMRSACRRLGAWLASDGLVRTCTQLGVRF